MDVKKPIFIDFRKPESISQLAICIGIEEKLLEDRISQQNTEKYFFRHRIPKRNPRNSDIYRIVWQASHTLANSYKSFARRFDVFARYVELRFPHECAYGYVRGRGTIDNARNHCKAPLILHADIRNFFPSISIDMIKSLLHRLGLQDLSVEVLAKFVTIEESLPLGLNPSPLLANLVCLDMDDNLNELAKRYGCVYTRYADDISISGDKELPGKNEIQDILGQEGFVLSNHKFRITKMGQKHYVTGLSVSDYKPHAPRSMKRRLRQELYFCKKFGIESHIERVEDIKDEYDIQRAINRIDGTVRYISSIEKDFPYLRQAWEGLLHEECLKISYTPVLSRGVRNFNFYLDESEISFKENKFLSICLVSTEDHDQIGSDTNRTLQNYLADPFSGGDKERIEKAGLHFSDVNEDLRKLYVDQISTMPFRSYVAYSQIKSKDDYAETYISIIKKILPYRLMACDRASVNVIFEENSKISRKAIVECVENIFADLKTSNNRRPIKISADIGKKRDHPCFSVPDFLLGIFSNYARSNVFSKGDRNTYLFERLRDKYRVIIDLDNEILYSRKRPFVPWL